MNIKGEMRGMLVFGILVAFLGVILVLQIYPYLQGQLQQVGTQMANASGYSVNTTYADTTASMLWGVIAIILILAFFVEVLSARR